MRKTAVITLAQKIVPKGRPRFAIKTGHAYTPRETVLCEHYIRYTASTRKKAWFNGQEPGAVYIVQRKGESGGIEYQHQKNNAQPFFANDEPLYIEIGFMFRKPKSAKRNYPIVKPDIDNLVKTIIDSLQKPGKAMPKRIKLLPYVFEDDSQVISIKAEKLYAEKSFTHVLVRNYYVEEI